jgi:hypothetical protein
VGLLSKVDIITGITGQEGINTTIQRDKGGGGLKGLIDGLINVITKGKRR